MNKPKPKPKFRFRDAITGRFLSACEALKRLATTVRERIRPK